MLEAIPNLILKDTDYRVTGEHTLIQDHSDYKVIFPVGEFVNFELYQDGYWTIENWETQETIAEGKATPPAHKSWVQRLIKAGYIAPIAYNEHMEWKSIKHQEGR